MRKAKTLDHVEDAARRARNDLHASFESVDVIRHPLATDADVNLDVEVVTSATWGVS